MVVPPGDQASRPALSHQAILKKFPDELAENIDFQQMFVLVDGVLPFEACLYYQVLPLFLEGSRLILGMVSPDDRPASDYVRRIISYHHYTLVPRQISTDALQSSLTAYLNHAGNTHSALTRSPSPPAAPSKPNTRSRAEQQVDQNIQPTLVVDSPDDLDSLESEQPTPTATTPTPPTVGDQLSIPRQPASPTTEQHPKKTAPVTNDRENPAAAEAPKIRPIVASDPITESPSPVTSPQAPVAPPQPKASVPPLIHEIPVLHLELQHLSSPPESLRHLPPKTLLQELLGRVLMGGIGRLYLEHQKEAGRVLWSQEGVVQSVVEGLTLPQFKGLIAEMKQFAGLSLVPVKQSKHVDLERVFRRQRLMMRFRFMPSDYGEEATIQVLRGAALRFYQQQQLALLERDALGIAKQLQNKLNQLRDRAHAQSTLTGARLEALPALSKMLRDIEDQIAVLKNTFPEGSDDETQPLSPPPQSPRKKQT